MSVELSDDGAVALGTSRRLVTWAVGLAAIGLVPIVGAFAFGFHDWPAFWSAGATVGTPDLVDADRHLAWQRNHGLPETFFAYPPGSAWLFAPFSLLPLGASFVVHGALMVGAVVASGWISAQTFGLSRRTAILALLAFAPVTASVVIGQNAPLGLLLAMISIVGLVSGRALQAGLAIGLLLYKPTYALPLIGLLVLRRRWAELTIVAASAGLWFLAGVAAAGGDWAWPVAWWNGVGSYLESDFVGNADKAVSIPGLIARLDLPSAVPVAVGGLIVLAAIPRLIRAPMLEAAVAACLVGVVVSVHAWGYDAALAAPFVLWLIAGHGVLREPFRTRFLVAAYLVSLLWLVSRQTVISAVAVVVIALVGIWFRSPRWTTTTARPEMRPPTRNR